MKTYLITGGAGFIGSNFIKFLFKKYQDNISIINLDRLTYAGNLENLKEIENLPQYKFIKGDIANSTIVDNIFKSNKIDYVVNFAAESHVDRSIIDPDIFVNTNVLGTHVMLNAAKKHWSVKDSFEEGKKFIQISTDEVYGSLGGKGFFREDTPLDPHSPYSASKAGADLIVKAYYDTYKMPINITRCSNNYGPYQFPEKLIPLIINNCLKGKEIPVYGDGLNIRDWLYVDDHVRAIDLVINNGVVGEVYNIGGHNEKSNIDIVKLIIASLAYLISEHDKRKKHISKDLIRFVEDRKGHDRRYAIDSSKIQKELNWKPETSFKDGITKTIKWYLDNKEWLEAVTTGEYTKYYEKMYDKKTIA